eukprot:scaffold131543_cov30-Phaeocystis_antarctica.AAC.1
MTFLCRLGCTPGTAAGCIPGTAARGQRHHRQSVGALPQKRCHLLSPMVGLDGCLRAVPGTRHAFHHIRLREALGGWLCCLHRRSAADCAVVPPSACNFAQCCLECRERLQRPRFFHSPVSFLFYACLRLLETQRL